MFDTNFYVLCGLSVAGCVVLHTLATLTYAAWGVNLKSFGQYHSLELPEKFVSTANGMVGGLCSFYLVVIKQVWKDDVIFTYAPELDFYLPLLVGYQLYDMFYVMIRQGSGAHAEMWAHHFAACIGLSTLYIYKQSAFLPVAYMISEITVLPVNIRYIVQKLGLSDKNPSLLKIIDLINLAFFLVFRTFVGPMSLYYGFSRNLSALLFDQRVAWFVTVLCGVNASLLLVLNLFWTRNLVVGIVKGPRKNRDREGKKTEGAADEARSKTS